jgi:hypothetical protein
MPGPGAVQTAGHFRNMSLPSPAGARKLDERVLV